VAFQLRVAGFGAGDIPPTLTWSGEPDSTASYVLIVEDPDAPAGLWTHWMVWDIPAYLHSDPTGTTGRNTFGHIAYGGPCPPPGRQHRYYFRLFAMDRLQLGLPAGSSRLNLNEAMKGRVIAEASCMERYPK